MSSSGAGSAAAVAQLAAASAPPALDAAAATTVPVTDFLRLARSSSADALAFLLDADHVPPALRVPTLLPAEFLAAHAADPAALPACVRVRINHPDATQEECVRVRALLNELSTSSAPGEPSLLAFCLFGPSSRPRDPTRWRDVASAVTRGLLEARSAPFDRFSRVVLVDPEADPQLDDDGLGAAMAGAPEREFAFYDASATGMPLPVLLVLAMSKRTHGFGARIELGYLCSAAGGHTRALSCAAYVPPGSCAHSFGAFLHSAGVPQLGSLASAIEHLARENAPVGSVCRDSYGNATLLGDSLPSSLAAVVRHARTLVRTTRAANADRVAAGAMPNAVLVTLDATRMPATAAVLRDLSEVGFKQHPHPGFGKQQVFVWQPEQVPDLVSPFATSILGAHGVVTCAVRDVTLVLATLQERNGALGVEFTGGGVDLGESMYDAFVRETLEEARVDIRLFPHAAVRVVGVTNAANGRPGGIGNTMTFFHVHLGTFDEPPPASAGSEVRAAFWTSARQLVASGAVVPPGATHEHYVRFPVSIRTLRRALAGAGLPCRFNDGKRSWELDMDGHA